MTATIAIIKRLFASNRVSFILTAIVVLCATTSGDSKIALSNGNYTWLFAIMTPFLFVFYDYTKLMHLGTSKNDFSSCIAVDADKVVRVADGWHISGNYLYLHPHCTA